MSLPTEAVVQLIPQSAANRLLDLLRRMSERFGRAGDDTEFMRESAAAVMEGPRRLSHYILWATVAFFVIGVIWARLAIVDEVTVAEGKVIPSSQVQIVQNLEGGIVSEILVKVGQVVQKDQAIMRIDDTRSANCRLISLS